MYSKVMEITMKWALILSMFMISSSLYARNSDIAYKMMQKAEKHIYYVSKYSGNQETGWGTGFTVLDTKNKVRFITAGHVCEFRPDDLIHINRTPDGKMTIIGDATVTQLSPVSDLCELTVTWKGKPVIWSDGLKITSKVTKDEYVYIVGYPKIPYMSATWGRLKGLETIDLAANWPSKISCLTTPKFHFHGQECYMKIKGFTTTAVTIGGGSGSLLLNQNGEVIAVVVVAGGSGWASSTTLSDLNKFLLSAP